MNIFGKSLSDYVRFSKLFLVLIAVTGLVRLALSLGGVPNSTVKWFSMTGLMWIAVVYYAIRVHKTGFGRSQRRFPGDCHCGHPYRNPHRQRERIQRAGVRLRGRRQDVVSPACARLHRNNAGHGRSMGHRVRNPGGNS